MGDVADMAMFEEDLEDDRGPTPLDITKIDSSSDAAAAEVDESAVAAATATASGMLRGTPIFTIPAERRIIEDRWLFLLRRRRRAESSRTRPNGMRSNQCCADFFG
jgi:hypothetical protein